MIFVLFVTVADILTFYGSLRYLSRRKRGDAMRGYWFGPVSMGLTGLAWASLALIALPDARHHADLRAVYLLFIVGSSATNVVGAAARRLYYFTSQIPMLGVVGVVFLASGDRVTRLLGFAVPIYFIVMTSLHHEVHTVVVSELELQEQNDEANVQLRAANAQLSQQALRDDLTGLANRPAFMARLDAAVAAARRDRTTIGVLYLDIDRFKVINDSLGHAVGDMVLAEAANRIMNIIRGPDVLARLGGDEFTMLLDGLHGRAEAIAIAERVAGVLAAPFAVAGRRFNVSASIGIATNLDSADDGEALLSHADAAQYRAKQGGRNRIEVFDIELRESIQRRLGDEQELRDALTRGDILAWYQPEVELRTGQTVGAEALARWLHAERGMLDASQFVPLAEEAGLVFRLDDRIVTGVVEARAGLALAGVDPRFRIWCNVSSGQLTRSIPASGLPRCCRPSVAIPARSGSRSPRPRSSPT